MKELIPTFQEVIDQITSVLPCEVARAFPAEVAGVPSLVVYLECLWAGGVYFLKAYRKFDKQGRLMHPLPVIGISHYTLRESEEVFYPALDIDGKHMPACRDVVLQFRYYSARHKRWTYHVVLKGSTHPLEAVRKMSLCGDDKRHLEYAIRRSLHHFFPYDFAILRITPLPGEKWVLEYANENDDLVALHLYLRKALGYTYE